MQIPVWTKPGLYGAAVGAVAVSIVGFSWGGWVTGSTAETMAKTRASTELTQAMVPVCLRMAEADPERVAKLASIRAASGFNRRKAIMDTGWATLPGADSPSRELGVACIKALDVDTL